MTVEKAPRGPRTTARWVRWAVLAGVLMAITILGVLHQRLGIGKPVGVDALCPFGGLETLGTLTVSATLVKRIALSSVLLLLAIVVTAFVFRRAFCGRICPLGYLQELFGGIGRRLFRKRPIVPAAIDRPARFLKYGVLVGVLALTWATAELIIRPYDPWAAYQHLSSPEVFVEFGVGVAVLGLSLAGSLVYDRFFCKYLCPMGAFLGLLSRFSVFKVRRRTDTCIDCKACDKACPTNVTVSTAGAVTSPECIDCGECVAACPVKDTLAFGTAKARRLTPTGAAVLSVATFTVLVGAATAAGWFDWTMPTLKEQMEDAGPLGQSPDASTSGSSDPSSAPIDTSLIKGSTTVEEIVEATGVPAERFTQVYGIPASEQARALKDLKDTYGCTPGDVRAFVALYVSDPAAAAEYVAGSAHAEEESH